MTERASPSLPARACCQHIASALENAAHLLCGCSWQLDLEEKRELKQSSEEDERPASTATFFLFFPFLTFSFKAALPFQELSPPDTVSTSAFSGRQSLLLSSPFIAQAAHKEHDNRINLPITSTSSRPRGHITPLWTPPRREDKFALKQAVSAALRSGQPRRIYPTVPDLSHHAWYQPRDGLNQALPP